MDVTTSLKSLLLVIQQYRDSRTAQNAAQLQKQVEEVSGLKCDRLLSSGQVLPSECVSGLVELAGNPNTSPALTSSIISLLAQLASDDHSREILHSSYNLTSTLAAVIHCHSATPGEALVLQCLQVLQKLTYNARIFQSTNYIPELVAFLMTNIQSHSDDVIMPCLGLMANLCRDNHSVQSHIKSLDNVKPFYRTLINFLAHNSLTVVVFTLSILASLTLNEKVGEKLFDAKNIHQTFQLVFNIIVNGDGTLTRKYSVDLLVDLLKNPKIADYLTRYQHFSACVAQVLGLLRSKDPDSAAKVLELLLAMCSVSGLRSLLCQVVFKPAGPKLRAAGRRQGAGVEGGRKAEDGLALVQWLSSPVEGAERCSLQALQLLNELLEEALAADTMPDSMLSFVEMLLPVLFELLKDLDPAQGDAHVRKHCHRITHVTTLTLPLLCTEDSTRSLVSRQVSAQLCLSRVEALLSCCHSNSFQLSDGLHVCAEALLKTLELMSKLRQQVKDMETSFYRMLQDQRMVTPLSLALTSRHREHVQTGLSLLFEATPLPDFPSLVLGESIAANNAYRQREAELSVKRVAVQEVPPPRTNTSVLDSSSASSRSVHSLVEKIQTGLELQEQAKDSHVSEIIDVYEQKLSAFTVSEFVFVILDMFYIIFGQVSDPESDQIIGLKLKSDTLCSFNDKASLSVFIGAVFRFNETERLLKELQSAHISLTKQNEALRRNQEALQLQQDKMASVLEERDEEIKSLQSDLQKKNSDIAGRFYERRELEDTVDVLRKELNKTEQARKDASIKASSLELQKSQLEAKLKHKEDELNKHSAMIAMIHSLSSGKMKNDVNLSL
uniref:Cellular inhibitor of PP2A n=1 Tax=Acanthochromis polyacanthus TaxID=80966 RepID=A0A3Q1ECV8_9TELE